MEYGCRDEPFDHTPNGISVRLEILERENAASCESHSRTPPAGYRRRAESLCLYKGLCSPPKHHWQDDRQRCLGAVYNRLPMPASTEEASARTILRLIPADIFRMPAKGAFRDLALVPRRTAPAADCGPP